MEPQVVTIGWAVTGVTPVTQDGDEDRDGHAVTISLLVTIEVGCVSAKVASFATK